MENIISKIINQAWYKLERKIVIIVIVILVAAPFIFQTFNKIDQHQTHLEQKLANDLEEAIYQSRPDQARQTLATADFWNVDLDVDQALYQAVSWDVRPEKQQKKYNIIKTILNAGANPAFRSYNRTTIEKAKHELDKKP